ncbi:protein of unknown function [Methylacidimicrobium sp. AP8]|nr:protein of unknown function [Methylacidimicrobium sp. AP8]
MASGRLRGGPRHHCAQRGSGSAAARGSLGGPLRRPLGRLGRRRLRGGGMDRAGPRRRSAPPSGGRRVRPGIRGSRIPSPALRRDAPRRLRADRLRRLDRGGPGPDGRPAAGSALPRAGRRCRRMAGGGSRRNDPPGGRTARHDLRPSIAAAADRGGGDRPLPGRDGAATRLRGAPLRAPGGAGAFGLPAAGRPPPSRPSRRGRGGGAARSADRRRRLEPRPGPRRHGALGRPSLGSVLRRGARLPRACRKAEATARPLLFARGARSAFKPGRARPRRPPAGGDRGGDSGGADRGQERAAFGERHPPNSFPGGCTRAWRLSRSGVVFCVPEAPGSGLRARAGKRLMNRREFLKGCGLSRAVGLTPLGAIALRAAEPAADFRPNLWLTITPGDRVLCWINKSEMGQGVYTSLPMILADELGASLRQVEVRPAPALPGYGDPEMGGDAADRREHERPAYVRLPADGRSGRPGDAGRRGGQALEGARRRDPVPGGESRRPRPCGLLRRDGAARPEGTAPGPPGSQGSAGVRLHRHSGPAARHPRKGRRQGAIRDRRLLAGAGLRRVPPSAPLRGAAEGGRHAGRQGASRGDRRPDPLPRGRGDRRNDRRGLPG